MPYDEDECSDDGYAASGSGNEGKNMDNMSDEEDIEMEQEDEESVESSQPKSIVMHREALQTEMNDLIKEATDIVEISPGAVRILLNHYKWDMVNLLERFYESSNLNDFLQKARVIADPKNLGDGVEGKKAECDICCRDVKLTGLSCRHCACKMCWEKYLTTKVLVDNKSIIECLYPGCKLLVDDEHFLTLTGKNETIRATFARLSLNHFVESNKKLRWCPAPGCDKAVKVTDTDIRAAECACKCRFCFECGKEWHEPMDCGLLKKWLQKCMDDSETSNWIVANTKDCPKCQVTIEKNGGCNHMTCKSTACGYEFCWICMGDWKAHKDNYNCSRYVESDKKKDSRAALEKYLHYYNRFMNHQQSLKLENKLYDTVKHKMDVMQKCGMGWVEVQFLLKAVDVLSECRRTLMYAYAFAYYVKRTTELDVFEDNQKDLELATEILSGFLERDMDAILDSGEDFVSLKQKVQDKYRYVDHRREVLLKHCAEGTERDAWQFNQC